MLLPKKADRALGRLRSKRLSQPLLEFPVLAGFSVEVSGAASNEHLNEPSLYPPRTVIQTGVSSANVFWDLAYVRCPASKVVCKAVPNKVFVGDGAAVKVDVVSMRLDLPDSDPPGSLFESRSLLLLLLLLLLVLLLRLYRVTSQ